MESTATTYTYQSTSPIPSIIALILCVIAIVGMWKTFVKAGVPGWHSLIPILNVYDMYLFSFVCYPILGFGDAEYIGPQ